MDHLVLQVERCEVTIYDDLREVLRVKQFTERQLDGLAEHLFRVPFASHCTLDQTNQLVRIVREMEAGGKTRRASHKLAAERERQNVANG